MSTTSLDLNGTWQLGWADGVRGNAALAERDIVDEARFLAAQVPGEIHLDLERAGLIDDVRLGLNALKARWVEENRWAYRKEFEAPPEALAAGGAWLVFEGLDLTARVVLNGEEIGGHNNAHYPCRLDVTGKLCAGTNVLVVHIESGLFGVADKALGRFQYTHDHRLNKRHWLRKAQCQFGWDWSIRLINVGIFRPVRLEWSSTAVIDQLAVTATLDEGFARGTVRARLFVESLHEASATLTVSVGDRSSTTDVTLQPGLHPYETTLAVDAPEFWWPAEHGPQTLYNVTVDLAVNGQALQRRAARVGFRTVRIIQDEHPQGGRYFVLEINGRKVFAKGANWAPGDMILARCDRASYERLLGLAREAHFNFFRVNGCGKCEDDAFFDLCDELGIMVWQDFPFTNIHFPFSDPEFHESCVREVRWNVRRLESHPSLVVWCGNNEMEWLGGAAATVGTEIDDITFFHQDLARIVVEEDPLRYYQPSSPFSPDGLEPNANQAGNQHPWDVGLYDTDFYKYRQMSCRFATEGGIMGAAALPTIRACLPPGEQRTWSFAWQQHDNSFSQNENPSLMDQMMRDWLRKDVRAMEIEEFCYWAGALQGEALREYADNFRRRMFDNAGAAFWDFNDFWPVARGWAIVDPYFRRAPSFYAVRRAFQAVSVVVVCEEDELVVFGVNDLDSPCSAQLRYGLFNLAGGYPIDLTDEVILPPDASVRLAALPRAQWIDSQACVAFAVLSRDGEVLARNRLLLSRFHELQWPRPEIDLRVENGCAVFQSPVFAWAVCLDLDGERLLADNMFDLYPSQPYKLAWPHPSPPRILKVGNL